jgi:hypothetical protein
MVDLKAVLSRAEQDSKKPKGDSKNTVGLSKRFSKFLQVPSSKFSGHKTQNLFDFKRVTDKKKDSSKKTSSVKSSEDQGTENPETEEERRALQQSEQKLQQKAKIYENLGTTSAY